MKVKGELEEEEIPQAKEEVKGELEEEEILQVKVGQFVKMEEGAVAVVKQSLDGKVVKTNDDLVDFRRQLDRLIGHKAGRGGGHHFFCLICLQTAISRQKARAHVEVKHVVDARHSCRNSKCNSKSKMFASLEQHMNTFHPKNN